jgi:hypothetical protein
VTKFEWKSGSRIKIDANSAGKRFKKLGRSGLTPDKILKDAEKPDSPFHEDPDFFWKDDPAAAEQWRLAHARHLINCLITISNSGEEESAYFYVRGVPAQGYYSKAQVMSDEDLRQGALEEVLRGIQGLLSRYSELQEELTPIQTALDTVLAGV